MTIKVYADRIEIGAKTITTTPTGIRIGDSLAANTQAQGYIRQANFTARELAFGAFGFQGSVSGFTSGGFAGPPTSLNTIDKFPFSSDSNASDHGDLTVARNVTAGQSSTTHGYASGGATETPPSITNQNTIDKFSFATASNAVDVGDTIDAAVRGESGQSSSISGYVSGGFPGSNIISKFPFATNSNATDVGDLTLGGRYYAAGHSSTVSGYVSGGGYSNTNTIDKFPFSTDANATDVGDLTVVRQQLAGQSSTTYGYASGGGTPSPVNTIDKFPFSADTNATDVGDLLSTVKRVTGQSSTTSGYVSGGEPNINTIQKFPFSADSNSSDVGDLTVGRQTLAGQQF